MISLVTSMVMDFLDVAELLVRIDTAIQHDRTSEALRLILSNFSHLDDPAPLRERVASILAGRGEHEAAVDLFEDVALHYANTGHPTRGLAVGHKLAELAPSTADSFFERFTALYNARSPFLSESARPASLEGPESELDLDAQEPKLDAETLLEMASERSRREGDMSSDPIDLPRIPLLSRLPSDALRPLLEGLQLVEYSDVTAVLEAGAIPDRLVWTVSEDVTIGRDDPTYRLPPGVLLGANACGTPPMPNRHDVVARDGSRLLVLPESHLQSLDDVFEDFEQAIRELHRNASIGALLERHPIFEELDEEEASSILSHFSGFHLQRPVSLLPADTSTSPGLFVLLDGQADLVRSEEDWEITVDTLTPGDVFGGLGLVVDKPDSAHVELDPPGTLLFLPREAFEALVDRHPSLARHVVSEARARLEALQEAELEDDDLSEVK